MSAFTDSGIERSAPFDCDELAEYDVLSCLDDGPQWWQLGRQVAWSVFVWGVVIVMSPIVSWVWRTYFFHRRGVPPRWVQRHIGTEFRQAKDLNLENGLCLAQFFASMTLVWIWVKQSYAQREITLVEYRLQFYSVGVCFLHSLFERMKYDFSIRHALSFSIFLDCLTLPPIITQGNGAWAGGSWLTLAYLRTYHCWTPMKRLLQTNFFDHVLSDFVQECVLAILECILVVFSIAGTLWVMEAMGDIEGFADQFTESGMGKISFFQMVYFSFITISTVGYGDFYPTTLFSRAFIVFAAFGGVIFFSYMTVHVFLIFEVESSGRGKFVPIKRNSGAGRGHILIMGGGITCGSVTILETFLRALCRVDSQTDTPEIVLLGQTKCSEKVRKMLKSEWAQGFKIHYFIGSPLDPLDLERVKASEASMVFIISDFHTTDTKTEDTGNALFASALHRAVPDVQFRLMLVAMPSLTLCSSIGLVEHNCFAIESLKAAMMATSIRCPGFSTLVLNLGLPDLPPVDAAIPGEPVGRWLKEYIKGCRLEPYGFLPSDVLIGRTFTSATLRASYLGGVLLLGCMVDGSIRINPINHIIQEGTVMFALAKNSNACDCVAKNGTANVASWIDQFQHNRKTGGFWKKQHAKTVKRHSAEELENVYSFDKRSIGGGAPEQHNQNQEQSKINPTTPNSSKLKAFVNEEKSATQGNSWKSITNSAKKASKVKMDTSTPWKKLARLATSAGNLGDLKRLAVRGGHTVVILQEDHDELDQQTLWEQLEVMVKGLAHAGDERPIVVVHSYLATPSRQRFMAQRGRFGFTNVSFCVGDPLNSVVLQAAGCDTCARLLTLAPSAPPTEMAPDGAALVVKADEKMDESNLMLAMVLEQHLHVWGRPEIKAIFDWYAPSSLNLLPYPPPPAPLSVGSLVLDEEVDHGSDHETSFMVKKELALLKHGSFSEPVGLFSYKKKKQDHKKIHPILKAAKSSNAFDDEEDKEEVDNDDSSRIKNESKIGSRINTSDTLEDEPAPSLDSLRNQSKPKPEFKSLGEGDQAYARRDPRGHYRFAAGRVIPKPFIAALYSMAYYTPGVLEIMESLINPAKYDQDSMPWIFKVPSRLVGFPYSAIAGELLEASTLPLGLLRAGGENSGTPLPYVVTLTPDSHIKLKDSDCVYVLAEHEWAVKHGLDCGKSSHMAKAWGDIAARSSSHKNKDSAPKRSSLKDVVQMTSSGDEETIVVQNIDIKSPIEKQYHDNLVPKSNVDDVDIALAEVGGGIEVVESNDKLNSTNSNIDNDDGDDDDDDDTTSDEDDFDPNNQSSRVLRVKGNGGLGGGGIQKKRSGVGVL